LPGGSDERNGKTDHWLTHKRPARRKRRNKIFSPSPRRATSRLYPREKRSGYPRRPADAMMIPARWRKISPNSWPPGLRFRSIRLGTDSVMPGHSPHLDAGHQLHRVAVLDRGLVGGVELVVAQPVGRFEGLAMGELAAEQHLRAADEPHQRGELAARVALRHLVIVLAQDRQRAVRHARILALFREADEPAGEERQRAARMRPDPADLGEAGRAAGLAEDQARD